MSESPALEAIFIHIAPRVERGDGLPPTETDEAMGLYDVFRVLPQVVEMSVGDCVARLGTVDECDAIRIEVNGRLVFRLRLVR